MCREGHIELSWGFSDSGLWAEGRDLNTRWWRGPGLERNPSKLIFLKNHRNYRKKIQQEVPVGTCDPKISSLLSIPATPGLSPCKAQWTGRAFYRSRCEPGSVHMP